MSFTGTPAQDLLTGLPPDVEDGGYVPEIGEEEIESEKGDDTESEEPEEDEDEDYISFLSSIVLSHVLEEEKEIMLDVFKADELQNMADTYEVSCEDETIEVMNHEILELFKDLDRFGRAAKIWESTVPYLTSSLSRALDDIFLKELTDTIPVENGSFEEIPQSFISELQGVITTKRSRSRESRSIQQLPKILQKLSDLEKSISKENRRLKQLSFNMRNYISYALSRSTKLCLQLEPGNNETMTHQQ